MAGFKGLTRVRRRGKEVPGSVWLARKRLPTEVRSLAEALPQDDRRRALFIGPSGGSRSELIQTTGETDVRRATAAAEAIHAGWNAAIAELKNYGDPADVAAAFKAIENWRRRQVKLAGALDIMIKLEAEGSRLEAAPGVSVGAWQWADGYFKARPGVSRALSAPLKTMTLLDTLRGRKPREAEGYDATLLEAVGTVEPRVKTTIEAAFVQAWAEVVQAREMERRYAAFVLALVAASKDRSAIGEASEGYEPRRGDRSIGDLIRIYKADYETRNKDSKDLTSPLRAVTEFFGADTPVRAVTRDQTREFKQFVQSLPSNLIKLYPRMTLAAAIEQAKRDKRPAVTTNTARNYLSITSTMWNFAVEEKMADTNPFRGRLGARRDSVRRSGFTNDELVKLFDRLRQYKAEGGSLFWVPALDLNGARVSELLQLRVGDVGEYEGTPYLDLSEFDERGRRDESKSVKTEESERFVPIHPLVLEAGFMDLVRRRREDGSERLFPDVIPRKRGKKLDWSHHYSKTINRILDDTVSDAPKLVAGHGFRHTLRERYRKHGLAEEVVDAIGGWAPKTQGRKYGRSEIKVLADALAQFDFAPLKL